MELMYDVKNKIKIIIYGYMDKKVYDGCLHKCTGHASSCEKCMVCSHKDSKKLVDMCNEIKDHILKSDVAKFVEFEFIDIKGPDEIFNSDIKDLMDRGFKPPFTVIDGMIRYYGGVSSKLIYRDVKELLS